jgi:retron-type reverse transcriptase
VQEKKRRDIAVAHVKDRIVHRLLYDYLVKRCDKAFDYDAWSCRIGKGNVAAITRASELLRKYPDAWIWRADIAKFFDSVDQFVLQDQLKRYDVGPKAKNLLDKVIGSYVHNNKQINKQGLPIGNLTSQVLANVYLSSFDHFVRHTLKPLAYMRYGDDFILLAHTYSKVKQFRADGGAYLFNSLHLSVHAKNDHLVRARHGIKYLGVWLHPGGEHLPKSSFKSIQRKVSMLNVSSYCAWVGHFGSKRQQKIFTDAVCKLW